MNRYLQFENIKQGELIFARCSICKKEFRDDPKPTERTDDVLLRMRAAFDAHQCNGDETSPAMDWDLKS